MKTKIVILISALTMLGVLFNAGCKQSSSQLNVIISIEEWSLEHVANGVDYVMLRIGGHTNGDRLTILTFGDGLINEKELTLDDEKNFNELVEISFSHAGYTPPVQAETTLKAYRGSEFIQVKLESGMLW